MLYRAYIEKYTTSNFITGSPKILDRHVATVKVAEIMSDTDMYVYAKYILKDGTKDEKRELLSHLRTKMTLRDGKIEIE